MTDIALLPDGIDALFDMALAGGALVTDEGLKTAIAISLFTDARAFDDDLLPDGTVDRRGWWADELAATPGSRIGSRLWLLAREKRMADVLVRARAYASEALAWLIEDGVAKSIDVSAEAMNADWIAIAVVITRPDGTTADARFRHRFDHVWEATQ